MSLIVLTGVAQNTENAMRAFAKPYYNKPNPNDTLRNKPKFSINIAMLMGLQKICMKCELWAFGAPEIMKLTWFQPEPTNDKQMRQQAVSEIDPRVPATEQQCIQVVATLYIYAIWLSRTGWLLILAEPEVYNLVHTSSYFFAFSSFGRREHVSVNSAGTHNTHCIRWWDTCMYNTQTQDTRKQTVVSDI